MTTTTRESAPGAADVLRRIERESRARRRGKWKERGGGREREREAGRQEGAAGRGARAKRERELPRARERRWPWPMLRGNSVKVSADELPQRLGKEPGPLWRGPPAANRATTARRLGLPIGRARIGIVPGPPVAGCQ